MHEKIDREKHPLRRRAELRISYGCARTEKNKPPKSLDEVDVVRDGSGDQRSYKPEVRKHLLASIERVARGEALAGGAPREPLVRVEPAANATYNDPELTKRLAATLRNTLGQANLVEVAPRMVFEDFSEFSLAGVPSVILWVGGAERAKCTAAQQSGTPLPGLQYSVWAPDREPTLKTAITAETAELLELLGARP